MYGFILAVGIVLLGVGCLLFIPVFTQNSIKYDVLLNAITTLISGIWFLGYAVLINETQKTRKAAELILNNILKHVETEEAQTNESISI